MSLDISQSLANPKQHEVSLAVELESTTVLAVRAGSFRIEKKDFELTEDWFWTLPATTPPRGLMITGSLVEEIATGAAMLFVEEKERADEEVPFTFRGTPYRPLRVLFTLAVPVLTATLSGLDVIIYHTKPPEERK